MCSDLLDRSTLECAREPRVSYRRLRGNRCLTYTSPIQNPITFAFWHFSMIFTAFKTRSLRALQQTRCGHKGLAPYIVRGQSGGHTSTHIHALHYTHRDQI